MSKPNVTRPVIRYYGGKWKLADWVISHFPKHRCYVEAFGGAASVLMKKKPSRVEVYNDLSDEVVNLFQVLRDPGTAKELRRRLSLTPFSRTHAVELLSPF
jgi:DNA adenine methylase